VGLGNTTLSNSGLSTLAGMGALGWDGTFMQPANLQTLLRLGCGSLPDLWNTMAIGTGFRALVWCGRQELLSNDYRRSLIDNNMGDSGTAVPAGTCSCLLF
jgi:hypothetical protein